MAEEYDTIIHYQGATFRFILDMGISDTTTYNFTGAATFLGTSHTLSVRKLSPYTSGLVEVEATDTSSWPIGFLTANIKATEPNESEVAISKTFKIDMRRSSV